MSETSCPRATLFGSDLCPSTNSRKERTSGGGKLDPSTTGQGTGGRRHEACSAPFRVQFVPQTQLASKLHLCWKGEWEVGRLL